MIKRQTERQKKDIGKRKDKGKERQPLLRRLLPPHKISFWLLSQSTPPPLILSLSLIPVVWMKSCNIAAPFGATKRECGVVSLVIPACLLSSWYSLKSRSRCLTLWTLSEHWHCVESHDGRRIRKGLRYPCPTAMAYN